MSQQRLVHGPVSTEATRDEGGSEHRGRAGALSRHNIPPRPASIVLGAGGRGLTGRTARTDDGDTLAGWHPGLQRSGIGRRLWPLALPGDVVVTAAADALRRFSAVRRDVVLVAAVVAASVQRSQDPARCPASKARRREAVAGAGHDHKGIAAASELGQAAAATAADADDDSCSPGSTHRRLRQPRDA
jgi:hypothetical protein